MREPEAEKAGGAWWSWVLSSVTCSNSSQSFMPLCGVDGVRKEQGTHAEGAELFQACPTQNESQALLSKGAARGLSSPSPQPDCWLSLPKEGAGDPQSQGVEQLHHGASSTRQPYPQGHDQDAQNCLGSCNIPGKPLFAGI